MYPYKYKDNKKKRLIKDSLGEAGVKKIDLESKQEKYQKQKTEEKILFASVGRHYEVYA